MTSSPKSSFTDHLFETTIPVGPLSVRMSGPKNAEDLSSRISFWWGITSAAIALSRHIQSMGDDLAGKRVLELGCGLGLAGITAGLLGANVLFTDYVRTALNFAQRNSEMNGLPVENARFRILDWENAHNLERFDLVIGSEIVYDYFFHGSLIDVLKRSVATHGLVLLADRKRLCVSRFIGRLANAGFCCTETVTNIEFGGFPSQEITVFVLRRDESEPCSIPCSNKNR